MNFRLWVTEKWYEHKQEIESIEGKMPDYNLSHYFKPVKMAGADVISQYEKHIYQRSNFQTPYSYAGGNLFCPFHLIVSALLTFQSMLIF